LYYILWSFELGGRQIYRRNVKFLQFLFNFCLYAFSFDDFLFHKSFFSLTLNFFKFYPCVLYSLFSQISTWFHVSFKSVYIVRMRLSKMLVKLRSLSIDIITGAQYALKSCFLVNSGHMVSKSWLWVVLLRTLKTTEHHFKNYYYQTQNSSLLWLLSTFQSTFKFY